MKGIDVSTYQGYPDWKRVKADGVDFAIIKAGQGRAETSNSYLFEDSKFKYNITNATAAGIPCGTYYYFTARTDAESRKEAQHYISIMAPYKQLITLYAAIDVESKHLAGINKAELSRLVEIFCAEVERAGYKPIVYTNPDWLRNRLNGINNRPLWLALWRNKNNIPSGYGDMKMWQWGASRIDGIAGNVDTNIGYFDLPGASAKPTTDYAKLVAAKCGFEKQTIDYLNKYQYATDLWRKLWEQMR